VCVFFKKMLVFFGNIDVLVLDQLGVQREESIVIMRKGKLRE